jgi:predicted nucleic acid-binding protein
MAYLADTNVMWRRLAEGDPYHLEVKQAIDSLLLTGETIYVTAQNLVEFQALATRPVAANGLGLTPQEANESAQEIESVFPLLEETPAIYTLWRSLMESYECRGRQVFDARLVAVMMAHGVTHILTRNPTDFRRFSEIQVIEPSEI